VTLRQQIAQEIRQSGPIPFSRYMETCLYHPESGYYSRNAEQFGKAGDFYTSSDVHAVFGRLLARQFDEMWRAVDCPEHIEILELGAGRGLFAQDVLDWSEKNFPGFFRAMHYSLAERSPALRERLRQALSKHFGAGKASLVLETAQGEATSSVGALGLEVPIIVFANEYFDALPVEVLSSQGKLCVSESAEQFTEIWSPALPEELEFLDRYSVHPDPGERIEVLLASQRRMSETASLVGRGFIVIVDYGYTRQEQLAGRHRGTLAAYRQHSASGNPYEAPGEQDLTAHVNFTALAAVAEQQGMQVQPLLSQSQFLLGVGEQNQFSDAFEDCRLPQERAKVALQLKHLINPEGMGETFHVLVASKGVAGEEVAGLSGLGFGQRPAPAMSHDRIS
jgi:SAM-dependent MidA family methyltransferase